MRLLILLYRCAPLMLLASCGTRLEFAEPNPAKTNIGIHSAVAITGESSFSADVADRLTREIDKSGYYRLSADRTDYVIRLCNTRIHTRCNVERSKDKKGKKREERTYTVDASLDGRIHSGKTGACYSSLRYSGSGSSSTRTSARNDAARSIARQLARDLIPTWKRYTVTIQPVRGNPFVEQSADACRSGNWDLGRQLAAQALDATPDEAEAYFLMGMIERHFENFDVSERYLQKAAELGARSKYRVQWHNSQPWKSRSAIVNKQLAR